MLTLVQGSYTPLQWLASTFEIFLESVSFYSVILILSTSCFILLSASCLFQWRMQGRGPGSPSPSPLFVDQTEARRAEKFFIWHRPPHLVWMTMAFFGAFSQTDITRVYFCLRCRLSLPVYAIILGSSLPGTPMGNSCLREVECIQLGVCLFDGTCCSK